MDYWRIVTEAWRVAWRNHSLWWLGLIRCIAGLVGGVVVLALALPLTLASALPTVARDLPVNDLPFDSAWFATILTRFWAWMALAFGVVLVVWLAFAILDVAAFGGLIGEVDQAERGQATSASRGLRVGFKAWWRVAGLLALMLLPTLIVLLVRAIALYFAVAVPLQAGRAPDFGAITASSQGLSGLRNLASLIAIPLGVIVQLAARFAVIDRVHAAQSLARAWDICKRKVGEVVLMYLVFVLIAIVVAVGIGVVITVFVAVAVTVAVLAADVQSSLGWFVGGLSGIGLVVAGTAFTVVYLPFQSALWNVFWQALTGRDLRFVRPQL